tara:strand:+ start:647 stop:1420 length:774 start_codon:yes stop_codon:yes gene_type:complete
VIINIIRLSLFLIKTIFLKNFYFDKVKSQNKNKENLFLLYLCKFLKNKNGIELGFHFNQFNLVGLYKKNYDLVLIDGGPIPNVLLMRFINLFLRKNLRVVHKFVDKKNINEIFYFKKIGIFSIDIDGNDYWMLKELFNNQIFPEVIVVEYNSTFLNKSITVPYSKNFDRFKMHKSGFYHGASLVAFDKLLKSKNYTLVKVVAGLNAFFVNKEIFKKTKLKKISSKKIKEENLKRRKLSKLNSKQQFNQIKNLRFIKV